MGYIRWWQVKIRHKELYIMELIIHIGAAKTGSTSIQEQLEHDKNLEQAGVLYLGHMLERAPVKRYEWQNLTKVLMLNTLKEELFIHQVTTCLSENIDALALRGIKKVIWSNEILFKRSNRLVSPIMALRNAGHDVKVIGYIRPHDSWLYSAYEQFNLYAKTTSGKVKSFSEWLRGNSPDFYGMIKELYEAHEDILTLRTTNSIKNLVSDFYQFCGLDLHEGRVSRANISRSSEELLFRVAYSNSKHGLVRARDFNQTFKSIFTFTETTEDLLRNLFPNLRDIDAVRDSSKSDIDQLKGLISEHDLCDVKDFGEPKSYNELNLSIVVRNLIELSMSQQVEIERLKEILIESTSS
jgi:hypothetical protein